MSPPNGHANGSPGIQDHHSVAPVLSPGWNSATHYTAEQVKEFVALLEVPFDPIVIEWRVTNTSKGNGHSRGQVIPYADQRAYVKGAFTGADSDHLGLIGTADGDTLFLDEIGDISRDVQRLLIRTLEEGIYHPLGSTKQERSTFRLIAATNLQLSELQRRLDPDFLDRISALQLRVPALRELPEDLGWLWNSTFEMATKRCGLLGNLLSLKQQDHQRIVERLKSFPLDGNLRDLFRVSNRLIASLHDQVNPLSILDAIEYAVNGLQSSTGKLSVPREVAHAFFTGQSLDGVFTIKSRLNTKEVEQSLQRFIASELRRIARLKGVEVEQLCDVSSRTLRDWAAFEEPLLSSRDLES